MDKNVKEKSGKLLEAMIGITSDKPVFSFFFKKQIDENFVFVVKEKGNYILVREANNVTGYERYSKHNFKSLNSAISNLNLILTESEKYVIKEPIPDNSKSFDDEMGVDMDSDLDSEDITLDDESTDDSSGEPIETDLAEYQELSGKLAYILKDEDGELDDYDATAKYVFNTLLASLKLDQVSSELLDEFKNKLTKEEEPTEDIPENYVMEMASKKGYIVESIYKDKSFLTEECEDDEMWESYSMDDVNYNVNDDDDYDNLLDENFIKI